MAGPFISFMTDFGIGASAPAVCRGVMLSIAPEARILDVTHDVRRFAVRDGAFLLTRSLPYFPVGIHVAVVDPGVGTARRPIAVRAVRGDILVGPDNGLLMPPARKLGGAVEVRELTNRSLWLDAISHTFHGRDIFSPVAAHLASGVPFEDVGPVLAEDAVVDLELPIAVARDGGLDTAILFVDAFGNCRLAGETEELAAVAGGLQPGRMFTLVLPARPGRDGERRSVPWVETFGAVRTGEALLYEDADFAGPALAVNQGSAAQEFGLEPDTPVRVEPT
jgi:S-adenosylmethionine hydrolase